MKVYYTFLIAYIWINNAKLTENFPASIRLILEVAQEIKFKGTLYPALLVIVLKFGFNLPRRYRLGQTSDALILLLNLSV